MLLRESNDNRRTDLATQQRILSSRAATAHHPPEPVPSSAVLFDYEREETDSGIHARLTSVTQFSARGGTTQTDAVQTQQGEQGLVSKPSIRNRGQDPNDLSGRQKRCLDHEAVHGEPRLARDDSEQFADMAFPVPALERSHSVWMQHHNAGGAGRDESASDGPVEPDDSADPTQLPAQDPANLVSRAILQVGISREEAREILTTIHLAVYQDAPEGGQTPIQRG